MFYIWNYLVKIPKKISLYWLLVLQFTIQGTVIVGIVSYLCYRSGQETVSITVGELMTKIADRTQERVSSYFDTTKIVAQSHAMLLQQGVLDGNDLDMMERHYVQQLKIIPQLSSIAIANENREFLAVERPFNDSLIIRKLDQKNPYNQFYRYKADTEGNNKILKETRTNYDPHNDPPGNPWYLKVKNNPDGIWKITVNLSQGENQPILQLARFVRFFNPSGQFQGVVATSIFLTQLGDFLKKINKNSQGQIFIIDKEGYLIATSTGEMPFDHTAKDNLKDNVNVKNRRLQVTDSHNPLTLATAKLIASKGYLNNHLGDSPLLQLTYQQQKYFVKITPLEQKLDLSIVTIIPESEFAGEVNKSLAVTIILTFVALVVGIIFSLYISGLITHSLSQLSQVATDYTQNQVLPELPLSRIREIAHLSDSFKQMMKKIIETERIRENYLESSLRQSKEELEDILENVSGIITRVSLYDYSHWTIDYVSGNCEAICGYSGEDLRQDRNLWVSLILAEDREKIETQVYADILALKQGHHQYPIRHRNGTYRWVSQYSYNRWSENEQKYLITIITLDVTAQKEAEIAIGHGEARFQSLAKASPAVIYTIVEDPKGVIRFEYLSPQVENIYELSYEDIFNNPSLVSQQIHPEDMEGYFKAVNKSLTMMDIFTHEWRIITPSRIKWLRGHSFPEKKDNGEIYWHGLIWDISDRKQI